MNKLHFSKTIRAIMKDRDLTQGELALILNIRQSQVSNLSAGKSLPSYTTLYKLHDKFGISYADFFEG
ncbi:MAG: helix-turn-helix domain-containing protein [Christensenellaceae bacterium]|jgi:transcriptional regulator with XRE-family HTH domain|nr:helix-turn-helix domain-containing protein [Christensenellaceae bacterium]